MQELENWLDSRKGQHNSPRVKEDKVVRYGKDVKTALKRLRVG